MKVAILNDTGHQRHFGCQLVSQAIEQLCYECDMAVLGRTRTNQSWYEIREVLDQCDLVILNGEGSMHRGLNEHAVHMAKVAEYYPTVLVNSVWTVDMKMKPERFLECSFRESLSQQQAGRGKIVPDLSFLWANKMPVCDPLGPIIAGDSVSRPGLPGRPHVNCLRAADRKYLLKVVEGRGLYTGRFHGACVAAMMNQPFACWPSNTWKTEGLLKDMGIPEHYHCTWQRACDDVPRVLAESVIEYVVKAPQTIRQFWAGLHRFGPSA